jgi:hypothetical protein
MTRYRIVMYLKIEAVVEALDAKAVAAQLGNGIGDVLLSMGAGGDGQDGVVEMQGEIAAVNEPAAPQGPLN